VSSRVGFWGECARVFCLGTPPPALEQTARLAFEMQEYLASLIVPGAIPSELFGKYCARLIENGFPAERRFVCHGQGYDVVESPFIRPENHTPLEAGAFIAIHPSMYDPANGTGCFVCDNYLLQDDGAKLLNKSPRNIIRVLSA